MHLQGYYILKPVGLLANKKRGVLLFIQQNHMASSRISAELFSIHTFQTYYCYAENAVCDSKTLITVTELKLKITGKKYLPCYLFYSQKVSNAHK
jgi:hypothetical protein